MCDTIQGQISFFDGDTPFKIDKPIRLIELFAGIGAQAAALERLGVPFEHYRICEFDKYAVKSYNAVHGTSFAPSDITKIHASDLGIVHTDKYCYIMTYSFPCQDLSLAGNQKGMSKGSGTRSGLLWEVERLLNECNELPDVLLMENVPQVCGKKNIEDFRAWCQFLEGLGYKNYHELLNSKNYGVPQNRNRCFMISLFGNYRYEFPKPFPLERRMKDLLEENVDEKYYLSENGLAYFTSRLDGFKDKRTEQDNVAILSNAHGQFKGEIKDTSIMPTLTTDTSNTWKQVLMLDEQNGYIRKDGCVGTLTTDGSSPKHNNRIIEVQEWNANR